MCGIVGAVDLRARREFPEDCLRRMMSAIEHRGPDDGHWHIEPGVALGAKRLSIVDLAGGRQPLQNETGNIWAAFNGELFEYPELQQELTRRGHRLATRCDTELWVHLYEDLGTEMFQRTKGQFAVSLWDRQRRSLVLGRDRFGIVPLFYAQADGWLLWSSEVKGLLASGMIVARPDVAAIDHFLTFSFSGDLRRSFFEGVSLLPPGTFLQVRDGAITEQVYWDLEYPDAGSERTAENPEVLVDELDELLQQAVRRRLRGDVPVVSYLSGGIDSTLVTALATKISGQPVPAYTIGLDKAGKDERTEAQYSADLVGVPLTVVNMRRQDMAEAYPELIRAAEAPVVDTTAACMLRLAQRVRADGFKVTLSGEGADEGWAGYPWYRGLSWGYPMMRLMQGHTRKLRYRISNGGWGHSSENEIGGVRPMQQNLFCMLASQRELLYSEGTWRCLQDHSPFNDLSSFPGRFRNWGSLHQSSYLDYRLFLHGHLLSSKGDRPAMHASLETRPPFLDEDVVEFAASVSPKYKLRGRVEKWLLREVANRYLPRSIAFRPKHGFRGTFSGTFLGQHRPAWVDQLLSPDSLRLTGLFDPAAVASIRSRVMNSRIHRPLFDVAITAAITIQLWHHIYCGGQLCELPIWSAPAAETAVLA